jgi:hypothetical protein
MGASSIKEILFTLSMMRRKSHVIITVEPVRASPNGVECKRGRTFVFIIFLIIILRILLIRVTRVYIGCQTSWIGMQEGEEHTKERKPISWCGIGNKLLEFMNLSYIQHKSALAE